MNIVTTFNIGRRTVRIELNATDVFYAVSAGCLFAGALLIWAWPAATSVIC